MNKIREKINKMLEKLCKHQLELELTTCIEMSSLWETTDQILALLPHLPPHQLPTTEEIEKVIDDWDWMYCTNINAIHRRFLTIPQVKDLALAISKLYTKEDKCKEVGKREKLLGSISNDDKGYDPPKKIEELR